MKNRTIICFSTTRWSDVFGSRQQTMLRLSKENKIYFIEPEPSLALLSFGIKGLCVIVSSMLKFIKGPSIINENLYVCSMPLLFPKRSIPIINDVNLFLERILLKRFFNVKHINNVIVWSYRFWNAGLKGKFNEKLFIYHCIDNFSGNLNPNLNISVRVQNIEKKMISVSDIIFVSSRALLKEDKYSKKRVHLLTSGVDVNKYFVMDRSSHKPPEDLTNIKHPILGYSGSINSDKLDFELIKQILKIHKDCSVVFIGPIRQHKAKKEIEILKLFNNFHYLGNKDVSKLPLYISYFDLCLIPYKINDMVKYIYPLKLLEYLASGKPVLSTYWPELDSFKDALYTASDREEFSIMIPDCMKPMAQQMTDKIDYLVNNHTWDKVISDIDSIIAKETS